MKTVKVVAAVIYDSLREKKSIFATARGYGEFKGSGSSRVERLKRGKLLNRSL
jgi:8-oxo-dGTP diphosphatase